MAQFPFQSYVQPSSTPVEKGSPAHLASQYLNGRKNLLTVVILSTINLLTLLLNASFYFPFSVSIPFYAPTFGMIFDEYLMTGGFFTLWGYGFAVAFILFFLICWLLSKERSGWMLAALVVFIVDTLFMAVLIVLSESFADMLLDIAFHALILYYFISAVIGARKLKKAVAELPQEEPAALAPEFYE